MVKTLKNTENIANKNRVVSNLSIISEELKSDSIKERQFKQEESTYWNEEIKSCSLGYKIAIQVLLENPIIFSNPLLQDEEKQITFEDCLIKNTDLNRLNDYKKTDEETASPTLQQLWNKSSKVLLAFYIAAQTLFEQKKFIEAHHVFTFLTILNQNIASFWIGRASANESMENWDKALGNYWMAQSINQNDVSAYQGLIRIYKKLKNEVSLEYCFKVIEKFPDVKKQLIIRSK
ncbi:MAG: hypothetical protein ACHQUC_02680 [Chlamydiales bacterium]